MIFELDKEWSLFGEFSCTLILGLLILFSKDCGLQFFLHDSCTLDDKALKFQTSLLNKAHYITNEAQSEPPLKNQQIMKPM